MNKMLVLCGPIGCGKTTLINEFLKLNNDFISVDVFEYVKKYKDEFGHADANKTIIAYGDMYNDIMGMNQNIILELGTNHYQLNMERLNQLADNFEIILLFCLLDMKICVQRTLNRAKKNPETIIHISDLREKIKRVFPDNHAKLADDFGLNYQIFDMSKTIKEQLKNLSNLL